MSSSRARSAICGSCTDAGDLDLAVLQSRQGEADAFVLQVEFIFGDRRQVDEGVLGFDRPSRMIGVAVGQHLG